MAKATKQAQASNAGDIWTPSAKGWVNIDTRAFTSEEGKRALALALKAQEMEKQAKEILAGIALKATGKQWNVSLSSAFWAKNPSIGFALPKEGSSAAPNLPNIQL